MGFVLAKARREVKPEKITRITWGPSGVTLYSSYGVVDKITEKDEMGAFAACISEAFKVVESIRKRKADGVEQQDGTND